MLLQSGDFEAFDPQRPTLPPPPRAPVFNRVHAAPPAGGFGWSPYAPHGADGNSYGPPAPGSLAPTAMAAYDTGSHRPGAPTVVIRSKPTLQWGIGIAIAGALIGGVLGVTMRNQTIRRAAANAQAANDMTPPPPPPTAVAQSVAGPTTIPSQPPQAPPQALAENKVVAPAAPIVVAASHDPKEPKAKPHRFFTFHAPPAPPSRPAVVATKVTPPPAPPPAAKEKPLAKDNSDAADLLKRAKAESGSSL